MKFGVLLVTVGPPHDTLATSLFFTVLLRNVAEMVFNSLVSGLSDVGFLLPLNKR